MQKKLGQGGKGTEYLVEGPVLKRPTAMVVAWNDPQIVFVRPAADALTPVRHTTQTLPRGFRFHGKAVTRDSPESLLSGSDQRATVAPISALAVNCGVDGIAHKPHRAIAKCKMATIAMSTPKSSFTW